MESKESTFVPTSERGSSGSTNTTDTNTTVHLNLHAQHNSLVDFTFINKLYSSNELTLVRLNALFEKIADRNAMAIRADKLFRLIFKAGQNKVTTERYRRILDIVQNENGKIKGRKGIFRVVSRGPFLAMFKHESISFVNSLESAARSLNHKKSRKKKNSSGKSISSIDSRGKEEASTTRQTIATAPASAPSPSPTIEKTSSNNENRKAAEKPKSLKRKKSEDKTGMIILADNDGCDEMSAVSVSPVNGSDEAKPENGKNMKFHVMESIKESSGEERILTKAGDSGNMSSSSKKSSRRKKKEAKQRSSKKAAKKKSRTFQGSSNDHREQIDGDSAHNRSNSSLESIMNIREVMQANASPRGNKRLKTENHHSQVQQPSKEMWMNTRDFMQHPPPYGMPSFAPQTQPHPYNIHPAMYHFPYSHVYPTSHVPYNQHMYNHSQAYHDQDVCRSEDELLCADEKDDCFIFGKIASFFKKVIGNSEKENVLDESKHILHHQNEVFHHPFANEAIYNGYQQLSHNASYMHHPSYNQEDYHVHHEPPTNWNPVSYDERYDAHMREKNEGRSNQPRNEDTLYNSSNKLKVYDFKPSIQLPEPERHQYKPSQNNQSMQSVVFDSRSDNHPKSKDSLRQYQDHDTSKKSTIRDSKTIIDYKGSKLKSGKDPQSLVENFKTSDGEQGELYEERSPPESNGKNQEIDAVHQTSEIVTNVELPKPSLLDPNQPKKHIRVIKDMKASEEAKPTVKKTKIHSQQKLTRYGNGKKCEKTLLGTRPKALGRSRSLSDRRSSRDNSLGETSSLTTRASSIGSAVSSLTDSSDLISEQSQNRSSVRYYHYR